jgi:hypothetical protein
MYILKRESATDKIKDIGETGQIVHGTSKST